MLKLIVEPPLQSLTFGISWPDCALPLVELIRLSLQTLQGPSSSSETLLAYPWQFGDERRVETCIQIQKVFLWTRCNLESSPLHSCDKLPSDLSYLFAILLRRSNQSSMYSSGHLARESFQVFYWFVQYTYDQHELGSSTSFCREAESGHLSWAS